ncbi:unnamed protein product, partial [Chrysoparadoxa australica]
MRGAGTASGSLSLRYDTSAVLLADELERQLEEEINSLELEWEGKRGKKVRHTREEGRLRRENATLRVDLARAEEGWKGALQVAWTMQAKLEEWELQREKGKAIQGQESRQLREALAENERLRDGIGTTVAVDDALDRASAAENRALAAERQCTRLRQDLHKLTTLHTRLEGTASELKADLDRQSSQVEQLLPIVLRVDTDTAKALLSLKKSLGIASESSKEGRRDQAELQLGIEGCVSDSCRMFLTTLAESCLRLEVINDTLAQLNAVVEVPQDSTPSTDKEESSASSEEVSPVELTSQMRQGNNATSRGKEMGMGGSTPGIRRHQWPRVRIYREGSSATRVRRALGGREAEGSAGQAEMLWETAVQPSPRLQHKDDPAVFAVPSHGSYLTSARASRSGTRGVALRYWYHQAHSSRLIQQHHIVRCRAASAPGVLIAPIVLILHPFLFSRPLPAGQRGRC